MKRYLVGLVMLAAILMALKAAYCDADGPDYWKVVGVEVGDVLNIRREANARSEKVGEITPDGNCIRNLKCVGGLTFEEFTNLTEAEKEKIFSQNKWNFLHNSRYFSIN